uniref:Putative terminase small subunit n=1 Tax=Siphoviridae sp. ctzm5103 TaxID=2825750 RepID=A0A8S5TT91_9CAUD|nr:MAG TPA: putative terminase small subunit [Siphoviridae sp. ctzm5103]
MGRHRNFKKKDVLDAIDGSYGIVSTVAEKLHCNWHTADEYIKKWPETLQALSDEEESKLDFVEGKAIKKINEDDGAMIRFYLATKGKKRGFTYDEKLEADETAEDKELNIITDDAATGGGEITEADE